GLDGSAKSDPERKKFFEEAETARGKDGWAVYSHSEMGWILYTRVLKAGDTPEYFLLIQTPKEADLLTEKDMTLVRLLGGDVNPEDVVIGFNDAGKTKLADLTSQKDRFLILVLENKVAQVILVTDKIDTGRMRIGAGLRGREQKVLHDRL